MQFWMDEQNRILFEVGRVAAHKGAAGIAQPGGSDAFGLIALPHRDAQ
jgi:hypothetical protein